MAAAGGAPAFYGAGDDETPPATAVAAGGEEVWGLPLTPDEEGGLFFDTTSSSGSSSASPGRAFPDDEFFCEETSTDGSECDYHDHWRISLDYAMGGTEGEMTGPMPQDNTRTAAVDLGVLAAANAFVTPETRPPTAAANGVLRSPAVRCVAALPAGSMNESAKCSSRKRSMGHDSNIGTVAASPSGETGECPICLCQLHSGAVVVKGRFAQYVPRITSRRDNGLGDYYRKWGYRGPKYCKDCSESFKSHLLNKSQRSQRATCTRQDPCVRCTLILQHFDGPKEQVFAAVDEGKRARSARKRQKQMQAHMQVHRHTHLTPNSPGPPALLDPPQSVRDSDHVSPQLHMQQSSRTSSAMLSLTGAVVVVALSVLHWSSHTSGDASTPLPTESAAHVDETEWACGTAAAAPFFAAVSPDYLASVCHGKQRKSTFPCDVNDCAAGELAIGQRMCRCDGCFRNGGRCAGWVLEGHGGAPAESGCGLNPNFHPDTELHDWMPPGVAGEDCDQTCARTEGCLTSKPDLSVLESQCTLTFSTLWPQALAYDQRLDRATDGFNRFDNQRVGMIWSTDSHDDDKHDIWSWVMDDGGSISASTYMNLANLTRNQLSTDQTKDSVMSDLHLMWQFNANTHTWQAVSSSLNRRPSPRVGAGHWVDGTGSLFLIGGLSTLPYFTTGGMVPFSTNDAVPESMYDQKNLTLDDPNTGAELWEYDTAAAAWLPLHTLMTHHSATGQGNASIAWPGPRFGSSVWRDRGETRAPVQPAEGSTKTRGGVNSGRQQTKIWMFGGWSSKNSGGTAATELWQYVYAYDSHGNKDLTPNVPGEWTLVTAEASDQMQPLFTCNARGTVLDSHTDTSKALTVSVSCPLARRDAGAWPSPNNLPGGWIFGGISDVVPHDAPVEKETHGLNDLWHWNGDINQPAWDQASLDMPPGPVAQHDSFWPPMWQSPQGWASDASGGELWLVGDSGIVQDTDRRATGPEIQDLGSNFLWRFSVPEGKWYRHEMQRANGAGLWPTAREVASIADGGLMYGGFSASAAPPFECVGIDDNGFGRDYTPHTVSKEATATPKKFPGYSPGYGGSEFQGFGTTRPLLSGMWRWHDGEGTEFYQ